MTRPCEQCTLPFPLNGKWRTRFCDQCKKARKRDGDKRYREQFKGKAA